MQVVSSNIRSIILGNEFPIVHLCLSVGKVALEPITIKFTNHFLTSFCLTLVQGLLKKAIPWMHGWLPSYSKNAAVIFK